MMQVGIFTGYFPYGLEETAQEDPRAAASTRCSSTCTSRMSTCRPARSPRTRRTQFAIPFATTTCRSAASRATRTSFIRIRPSVGGASAISRRSSGNARYLGSPYVISETGTYNTESDWVHDPKNKTEERLRGVPQGGRRSRPDGLRSRRRVPARNLRQQRRRIGRGDGADVRRRSTIPGSGC